MYHPGTWDFGIRSENFEWDPHWTCCAKKDWKSIGCTKGIHRGPVIDCNEGQIALSKPIWPDEKAKLIFERKNANKSVKHINDWLNKVKDKKFVKSQYSSFCHNNGFVECRIEHLESLMKMMRIQDLAIGEDIRYHYLYSELMNKERLMEIKKLLICQEAKNNIKNNENMKTDDYPLTAEKFL